MTLDAVETGLPAPGVGARRSPRNVLLDVRRSRMNSNDSENSNGSGKSHDTRSLTPAINLIPGSAPASRAGSFRDRPSSADSFRLSSSPQGLANGREASNTSSVAATFNDGSMHVNVERADEAASMGPRRNSMPSVAESFLRVPSSDDVKDSNRMRRVRSFKTTSKGVVVNRGDSFKKKSTHSLMSTGSAITDSRPQQANNNQHQANVMNNNIFAPEPPPIPTYYRVIMMGAAGCGKTMLTKQFMTSDFVGGTDDSQGKPCL